MTDNLRTFVAVKVNPSPVLLQVMNKLKGAFSEEPVKWINENNLHTTLKFIGNTSQQQAEEIKKILIETAGLYQPFSFRLQGLGFFKSKGNPRVLFAKTEAAESLVNLASDIDKKLSLSGFEPNSHAFKPHLTLSRIKFLKNKTEFYENIERYRDVFLQEVVVDQVVFYQSILTASAAEYKPLAVFTM